MHESTDYRYAAFISYRHTEPDRRWAKWLHGTLETYRIPKKLCRQRGVPRRIGRVFRDEEELPASADLSSEIETALKASKFLIVVCSPRTPKSEWVNREVELFRQMGRHDRILALLIEGEPRESFPRSLVEIRRTITEGGDAASERIEEVEPLAADVRPTRAERRGHLGRMARLRLLACVAGVTFDDLRQREQERRMRFLAAASCVLLLLFCVMGTLTGFALHERRLADQQRQLAQQKQREADEQREEAVRQKHDVQVAFSGADCAAALDRLANNQWPEAVAYLCRAIRSDPNNHDAAALLASVLFNGNWVVPRSRFDLTGGEFLALDSNGRRALIAEAGTARICDIDTQQVIRTIAHFDSGVIGLPVFTPDGKYLIFAASGGLRKLDIATGLESSVGSSQMGLRHNWFGDAFRFSPDGQEIVLGGDQGIQSWAIAGNKALGAPIAQPANPYDGIPCAINADGSCVLAGFGHTILWGKSGELTARDFQQRGLRFWDTENGQPLSDALDYSDTRIQGASFSPDGHRLAAATMDATPNIYDTLRIWNADTGEISPISIFHDGNIQCVSWSADGRHLLTASGNIIRIFDAETGRLAAPPLHAPDSVQDAWFSPDGDRIIAVIVKSAGVDLSGEPGLSMYSLNPRGRATESYYQPKTALIWDATLAAPSAAEWKLPQWVLDAQFSPDGRHIVTTSGNAAQIWDGSTHEPECTLAMDDVPVCVQFSPDGSRVLLVSNSETARLWDVASGRAITPPIHDQGEIAYAEQHNNQAVSSIGFNYPAHPDRSCIGAFSPDGKSVAVATGFSAQVCDAATGRPVSAPMRQGDSVNFVCFSPDSHKLLVCSREDGLARLWDIATSQPVGSAIHPPGPIMAAALSPDGRYTAIAASDSTTQIWDSTTGRAVFDPIRQATAVQVLQFSADSKSLLTVAGDTARVWDAGTGEAISPPIRSPSRLTFATFSPDGAYVATSSQDKTARVWEVATGRPASVPIVHDSVVNVVSFSADGSQIITADENGNVKITPFDAATPPDWILNFAETLAGCSLDKTGSPSYLPGKPVAWLRQQAIQEMAGNDAMVNWARRILKVEGR